MTYFQNLEMDERFGGGNRSTRRKPPTYRKSLTNFISSSCIEYTSPELEYNTFLT
jgi:hypothetical protein